ncbi:pyridoxamine 5'-phosphate oxidase family protein [Synechococcus sp. BMK-MC-1]|uniref:pyridoxamine 5'-phosphate oxidase family protein n=1 Tax=Synechococcus sp. BMK-MC-1 TaxID=1442551 RepID=UPI001646D548|nr:pyridoxamine 5'-phosphate oxidase family protein [Synechococcus sp. BMK-MC-1]QNI67041.1 pyridoxamine 5'-phosphate oxidase [Synechococcus sp. BMK-MC-1]
MPVDAIQAMPLPPWRPLLRGARQREGRAPGASWLQLASVAADGTPRVRTLVFRGWSDEGDLELLSDARSEKPGELSAQVQVELCWLFRKAREQFRLRGIAQLLSAGDDPEALNAHWQRLAPAGRSVWAWPHPGEPFEAAGPWPDSIADGEPPPPHLLLIRIQIQRVEQLDLKAHPHRRCCWERGDDWIERRLNP